MGAEAYQLSIPGHRLHARAQELAGRHNDTAQGPQTLGLTEAGQVDRRKPSTILTEMLLGACAARVAHEASEHMVALAA